jgi:hypothetical protein
MPVGGLAILVRGFEGVHGRAVILPEGRGRRGGRAEEVECVDGAAKAIRSAGMPAVAKHSTTVPSMSQG